TTMPNMTSGLRSCLPLALSAVGLSFGGCAGTGQDTVRSALQKGQHGYQLAIEAIGCWFGGEWADAEGFVAPQRRAVTEARCREVVTRVYGDAEGHLRQMRAMEEKTVEDVAQKA